MKYKYQIVYNIKADMYNWRDGVDDSIFGNENINNIKDDNDRKIAQQIKGLKKRQAEKILKPYLLAKKADPSSRLNSFIKIAEKDFADKYVDACKALERITKHPMVTNKFKFFVTTYPRMIIFYKERQIFMYDSIEGVWGMPIDGFLHEAHHFQFIHYWRENKKSPVSKLSSDEFQYLKEALVVVLDDDLRPINFLSDKGYPSQAAYCELLHEYWLKCHDFDQLVDFGLKKLKKYITT